MAYYVPPENAFIQHGVDVFIEEVEEKTEGRIEFEVYPNEQLGKATDSLEMLKNGVADIALFTVPYHPEELPLNQAFSLPLGHDAGVMTGAMWRALHEESVYAAEMEDAGIIPLMVMSTSASEIATSETAVPDLDSLKGVRVRAASDIHAASLSALGASPLVVASPEIYTALERKTIDGILYPFASWKSISAQELLNHSTANVGLLPTAGVNVGMGASAWEELSAEDQEVLMEAGRQASTNYIDAQVELDASARAEFEDAGLQTYEWTQEDLERMSDLLAPVVSDWFADAEDQGYDGQSAKEQLEQFAKDSASDTEGLPSYTDR